jgi:hypothetical protein
MLVPIDRSIDRHHDLPEVVAAFEMVERLRRFREGEDAIDDGA